MIKRVLVVSMVGLSLVGCVNNDTLSGDVYTASEAKQVQNVSYGTIVNVRQVQIQGGDDSNVIGAIGGAVLGGFLGNTIGGGTGRSLATAAGAVAGGVAGQGVQSAMNKTQGEQPRQNPRSSDWQIPRHGLWTGKNSNCSVTSPSSDKIITIIEAVNVQSSNFACTRPTGLLHSNA